MKKVTIEISGMHCASCASNVERSLSKTPGVKNARVNIIAKKGYADVDDNVTEEAIKSAVKKTGYQPVSVKLE